MEACVFLSAACFENCMPLVIGDAEALIFQLALVHQPEVSQVCHQRRVVSRRVASANCCS